MNIRPLDYVLDHHANAWMVSWFICGVLALSLGFWLTTAHTALDWFYLAVSITGLLCVLGLSFRKNILGNGLGLFATIGEVIVQATAGAVGLMLAPSFNFFSHVFGLYYWSKNKDGDGNMLPKSASKTVWVITLLFIALGLILFPTINRYLAAQGYAIIDADSTRMLGVSFFWWNVLAFVLAIGAQTTMILRYAFNWWLWILVNLVWFSVNVMTDNYIFAIQAVVYQINAAVGLYEWQRQKISQS